MDVKTVFLNRYLDEEVFVEEIHDFIDPFQPKHVFKLDKALYRLKHAPRAWYERLASSIYPRDTSDEKWTRPFLL